ncbi:MAG: IS21 family transposase [Planctomycetes bacterium]|nr:IS21 family transposase [Planctomycetota bacterium]
MIDVESWESIRRGYYVEGKSMRALMRETGHSFRSIRRIIEGNEPGHYVLKGARAAPVLGAYKAQIEEMVAANASLPRKQRYTSSRIYQILQGRGFGGAESTVRHYVSRVRKKQRKPQVYLPLSFEPGRDGQADWGEAEVIFNGECVTVQLFVMRLNYSRRIFVMAFPSQKQEAFFQGHVAAFRHFGGVPWRLTYDNLTAAVQKVLQGKRRQEQTKFLAFRGQYLFESHFCTPGEGHEKGGVEHSVGYVRRQYLVPRPEVASFAELNAYLCERCVADDGRVVKGQPAAIGEMWQQEQPSLRPLPTYDYDCCQVVEATLTPYSQVIVETNRYSVPVAEASTKLVVKLYPFQVEIYRAEQPAPLAVHERCYGREQDIFDPLHYLPLLEQRPGAFDYATPLRQWRTTWPAVYETLLAQLRRQWPEGRGIREFVTILQLHQHHSAELIAAAITQALEHHCAHADGVQLCLHQLLTPEIPSVVLDLQHRPHLLGLGEQAVNLAQYDALVGGVPCP